MPSNLYVSVFVSCYISTTSRLTLHLVLPNVLPSRPSQLLATSGTSPRLSSPIARGMSWGPQLQSVGPPKVSPVELSSHPRGVLQDQHGDCSQQGGFRGHLQALDPPLDAAAAFVTYGMRVETTSRGGKNKSPPSPFVTIRTIVSQAIFILHM
jgi:hypothetical protein